MTLTNLRNKAVIATRLTTVSGNKQAYATTTAHMVEIQMLSPEKTNLFNGAMGKTYQCYADALADIVEGDKLRQTSNGNVYKVKTGGVTRRSQGSIDYLSVIVEQVN